MTNNEKETPLHLAVDLNLKDVVVKLIRHNANVNCKDGNGNTPLHLAVKSNNSDIVQLLFKHAKHVNVDERNNGK